MTTRPTQSGSMRRRIVATCALALVAVLALQGQVRVPTTAWFNALGVSRGQTIIRGGALNVESNINVTGGINLDGGHLSFPATQNASSSPNTLDDYEEGTWTPVEAGGTGVSFTVASATYTKVGRVCYLTVDVTYGAIVNTSDDPVWTGVPATCVARSSSPAWQTGAIGHVQAAQLASAPISLSIAAGTTTLYLELLFGNGITYSNLSNSRIIGTFVIITN